MKPLFFITSALSPSYGVFSLEERYEQTKETIVSIRTKVPEAEVFLADVSVNSLPENIKNELIQNVHYFMDLNDHSGMLSLSKHQQKSMSEALMTLLFLDGIKQNDLIGKYDRIFKITGRMQLDDGFDINSYENLHGKYVFSKKVQTWMNPPYKDITCLYNTRLYSFCSSLTDNFHFVLESMMECLNSVDLEHAMCYKVPKDSVVEFDRVYCKGRVASDGQWKYD
jgi:hypothetical protein